MPSGRRRRHGNSWRQVRQTSRGKKQPPGRKAFRSRPQELQKPLPPPEQNAAPLYTKLTKLLHDKPLGLPKYAAGMDAFHTYTPEQIAAVRRTLAARQDVMTLVHQAADKPQCVFVRDWKKGTGVEHSPNFSTTMSEAVRGCLETESYLACP